jgi:hypothetical protein
MKSQQDIPDLEAYVKTYVETQKPDKVGLLAKIMSMLGGGGVGYSLSQTIAGWFGANIITYANPFTVSVLNFLPASLVKAVGISAVATVTTPVGWIIGSTLTCATIGLTVAHWVHRGGIQDERRRTLGLSILQRLEAMFRSRSQAQQQGIPVNDADLKDQAEAALRDLADAGVITPERKEDYIQRMRNGEISVNAILNILRDFGRELVNPSLNPGKDPDAEMSKATAARAYTAMHKSVSQTEDPDAAYLHTMHSRFGVNRERAVELYREAPRDATPEKTAEQLRQIFVDGILDDALSALQQTARSMQLGQAAYARLRAVESVLERRFTDEINRMDQAGQEAWDAIERLAKK